MNKTIVLCLVAATLAGCQADEDQTTTLVVVFADGTRTFDIPFDEDARPTADRYASDGAMHPDFYSAFDQIEDASAAGYLEYEAAYYPEFGAYLLSSIDGTAPKSDAYWALARNDEPAEVGMGDLSLEAGDVVSWTYTPVAAGDASLRLVVEEATTKQALVDVAVEATPGLAVDVVLDDGGATAHLETLDGSGTVSVPLPFGRSVLRATADDGTRTLVDEVPMVRLAEATVQVRFNGYPGKADRDDTLWLDIDAYASGPAYADVEAQHPDHANIHDLLVTWEKVTGLEIEYSYSGSFGYGVARIDGAGNPVDAAAPPWWCYAVNGEAAELGITLQPLAPGDVVLWDLGDCSLVPA